MTSVSEWVITPDVGVADPQVIAILEGHLTQMREISPPGSMHALDLEGLREPSVMLWAATDEDVVVGVVALKQLDPDHVELKSMRTLPERRRQGVATALLRHALSEATAAGYGRISLETGSDAFFAPARTLYQAHGFRPCGPFADYGPDPNSSYFTLEL